MKVIFPIIYTVLFISSINVSLHAEIYRYVDSKGQLHFTDQPPFNQRSETNTVEESTESSNKIRIYRYEEMVNGQKVIHLTDKPKHSGYVLIYEGLENFDSSFGKDTSHYTIHQKYLLYDNLIQRVASEKNVEAALLHAVIQTESAYNPYAVSPKGATGLMQLMPGTAKRYGVTDRTDAESNVEGGASYLRDLLKLFKNDKRLALAAYNAGEKTVERYGNNIPPYKETTNYVRKVIALYNLHLSRSQ